MSSQVSRSPAPEDERLYDDDSARALIDALPVPASVMRESIMLFANASFFSTYGRTPEEVLGKPFYELVPPEDVDRIRVRYGQRDIEGLIEAVNTSQVPYVMIVPSGRVFIRPYMRRLPAADGGKPYILVLSTVAEAKQPELDLGITLANVAANLVGQPSEEGVRAALLEGFKQAGLSAEFSVVGEDGAFTTNLPIPLDVPEAGALCLAKGHPIFAGGVPLKEGLLVLPICPASRIVLTIAGPGLSVASIPHLGVFVRLFSEAIANARSVRETRRQNEELRSLAEMARLASDPHPATVDEFLSRIVELVGGHGAALCSPEGRVIAQLGLGLPVGVRWDEAKLDEKGIRSVLRLVTQGDSFVGTLKLFREAPFTVSEARTFETLGSLLGSLLEHRRLRELWNRQLTETRLLLDLARTTSGTLDTASILDVACDFLVKLLEASNSYILLLEPDGMTLRGAAGSATHRESVRSIRLSLDGTSIAARAARERRPVKVEDTESPDQLHGAYDQILRGRFGGRALLALPLITRDELIGAVVVDDTRGPRKFPAQLVELAQATIGQLALSITNARLYESLWRSYAELAATRAEMVKRERLAALGELSAVVAHEVRNPLGAIFNAVASLKRLLLIDLNRPSAMEDASMLLEVLAEESERLDGMVGDLLDFTRPRELMLTPEPVGPLIQECLEAALHQPGISVGPVSFVTDFEPELTPVPMDRKLMRQALVNITVNAVQAMPRGGRIFVRARRQAREGGEVLRIDITDEGAGVPEELLSRVFEPFFTTKAKGTGLGLAVVRRIIEEHRGEISVSVGAPEAFADPLESEKAVAREVVEGIVERILKPQPGKRLSPMAAHITGPGVLAKREDESGGKFERPPRFGTTFTVILPIDPGAGLSAYRRFTGGKG